MLDKTILDKYLSQLSLSERNELDEMDEKYIISGVHSYSSEGEIPRVKGFVRSAYSPLIYESLIKVCEAAKLSADVPNADKKAVISGSRYTDAVTEQETWRDMLNGKRLSPIMFPQSVPSAVIGFTASVLNINGPMTCISLNHPLNAFYMLRQAWDWLREGDAEVVLLTFCDVPSLRGEAWVEKQSSQDVSEGKGVFSLVMETIPQAIGRQVEKTRGIKETLYQILTAENNYIEAWAEQ